MRSGCAILQLELLKSPQKGSVIKGSGGLRKLRISFEGRGKRGGRVIYLWVPERSVIGLVLVYDKTRKEDISSSELKALRDLARRFKESI